MKTKAMLGILAAAAILSPAGAPMGFCWDASEGEAVGWGWDGGQPGLLEGKLSDLIKSGRRLGAGRADSAWPEIGADQETRAAQEPIDRIIASSPDWTVLEPARERVLESPEAYNLTQRYAESGVSQIKQALSRRGIEVLDASLIKKNIGYGFRVRYRSVLPLAIESSGHYQGVWSSNSADKDRDKAAEDLRQSGKDVLWVDTLREQSDGYVFAVLHANRPRLLKAGQGYARREDADSAAKALVRALSSYRPVLRTLPPRIAPVAYRINPMPVGHELEVFYLSGTPGLEVVQGSLFREAIDMDEEWDRAVRESGERYIASWPMRIPGGVTYAVLRLEQR